MLTVQGSKFENNAGEKSQQRKGVDFTTAFENYNVLSKNGAHKRSSGAKPHLGSGKRDEVTIHVCDEGRQTSKYFFCQRSLLIAHMKYFERFLAENEGNSDLDISVYCDIEIFEWLMNYIHDPIRHPQIDKSIVVSILISSEFLQMDSLVDICLENIAERLHEIIKLPIDMSCIADKLINKLAALTHPKVLSQTIDRKDKILNKLYKRRVELDFSRRGGLRASNGTLVNGSSGSSSSSSGSGRSIAASLTCCKYCGTVYLENYVTYLPCTEATPTITFRGSMVRRHSSIIRWSLTSYLKTLHSGGMNWEAIYWHVWAACTVMKPVVSYSEMVCDNGNIIERGERGVRGDFDNSGRNSRVYSCIDSIRKSDSGSNSNSDINIRNKSEHNLRGNINSCGRDLDFMISGLDVDRYSFQDDGLLIYDRQRTKNNSNGINNLNGDMGSKDKLKVVDEDDSTEIIEKEVMFSLNNDDDNNPNIRSYKMPYTTDTILESYHTMNINQNSNLNLKSNNNRGLDPGSNTQGFTSSLNPTRQVHILPREIFDLLVSQAYLISGYQHTQLISSTARATVLTAACTPVLTPPGPGPTVNSSSTLKAVETVSVSVSMSVSVSVSDPEGYSYAEILWGDSEARARRNTAVNIDTTDRIATTESGMGMGGGGLSDSGKEKDKDKDRGRARSAGRAGRKVIRSTSKIRNSISGTSTGVSTGIGTGSLTPSTASSTTINAMVSGTVSTGVGVVHSRGGSREDSSRGVENGRRRASFPVCLTPALTLTPVLVLSSSSAKETSSSLSTVTDDIIKDEADIVEVRKPRVSASITANLTVMSALSSDILKMMEVGKGSVDGIWFTPHPLQLQPVALLESMQAVSDCRQGLQLSIEKQQTWQLDLLRDYDEQRMFRYETFLSGLRSPSMEEQLKSRVSSLNRISATASSQPVQQRTVVKRQKNVFSTEYYRDRGRQSNK